MIEHPNTHEDDLSQRVPPETPINIEDAEEAVEFINGCLERGMWPVLTMPVEFYEKNIRDGIPSIQKYDYKTQKGYSVIAATIGREPFLPPDEQRVICKIDPRNLKITPRMTGKDAKFHGVVAIHGSIPKENIITVGVSGGEETATLAA